MTFKSRLAALETQYSCQIVNRGTDQLAVNFGGKLFYLWPETKHIQLRDLTPVPREVKQFTESVIDLQEQMGFVIH